MASSSVVRLQIESALAQKIPSALTPAPRMVRPVAGTGIEALDDVLRGGLPIGAVSEVVGPECSGRTSLALSFLAKTMQAGKVCAWIDVSNTFDPLSAAAIGVDLSRLLWVRCGVQANGIQPTNRNFTLPEKYLVPPAIRKGLHGGGFGPHPRTEANGLSQAVSGLLRPEAIAPRCAEPQRSIRPRQEAFEPNQYAIATAPKRSAPRSKPWSRIEQALRSADLLLQGGGFSAIVLDMGSLAPEFVSRVPLATWHRYRLASERTQSSILLLTQHPCAKSSAELLLRLHPASAICDEATVFTGIQPQVEVARQRFTQTENNIVSIRKPPRSVNTACWQSRTSWAGCR
ncbi:MAG: ATPase domain-containing protein [Edaphobacter sp.]